MAHDYTAGVDPNLHGFQEALGRAVEPWGLELSGDQLDQLAAHYAAMAAANETMNLTRIVDPMEAAIKHYADSLAIVPWALTEKLDGVCLLDVGTGAGFPALPVAVVRPEWRVTAIDGTKKKSDFVARVAGELGLQNLTSLHAHSDHWETRERFDVVATRAVASLEKCMRTAGRFLKRGGKLIAFKTASIPPEELEQAKEATKELGMILDAPFLYELKINNEKLSRALYIVRRENRN